MKNGNQEVIQIKKESQQTNFKHISETKRFKFWKKKINNLTKNK